MLKIEIYSVLGQQTVAVEHYQDPPSGGDGQPHGSWESLSYSRFNPARLDTPALVEMVGEAIERAERPASERGGWSLLT